MTILSGEVALVTGAAGGIGHVVCKSLLAAGARVAAADVDKAALAEAVDSLGVDRSSIAIFEADLADDQAASMLPGRVREHFGSVDLLVNNAAVRTIASVVDMSPAQWRHTLDVNLTAPFVLSRSAIPLMIAQGRGKIVNIASMFGEMPFPDRAAYSVAKAGLIMLTKAITIEYGAQGIWCNAVAPGVVETPLTASYFQSEKIVEMIRANAPMGRWAQPDEICPSILFLCGRESDYVNGTTLFVDGGWTAGKA